MESPSDLETSTVEGFKKVKNQQYILDFPYKIESSSCPTALQDRFGKWGEEDH